MYQQHIQTKAQALAHLFFHCCLKDGSFGKEELQTASDMMVSLGLDKELNFTDEMRHYRALQPSIKDETSFLAYLIKLIRPTHKLALFSFCAELFLSDKNVTLSEEVLINKLASLLYIAPSESKTIQDLVCQLLAAQKTQQF